MTKKKKEILDELELLTPEVEMRITKIVKSVIKVKFAEMRKHNICSAISGTEVRVTP